MSDELNKDVVGARINLDTSKILQSFKTIDEGARGNAESFKILNTEISNLQKSYTSLASAADKVALSSEERRKKILAESEALVKQRTAQAELLNAKKNQLDQSNNITQAKLQVQQAIVKKHEAAIEQQEKEHQQRLTIIQQKTSSQTQILETRLAREQQALKSGQSKIEQQEQQHQQKMALLQQKIGSQDNLIQSKLDRQFQLMKNGNKKLEMEQERHAARMRKMTESDNVLERSSQYMLSGTMYYGIVQGATEAVRVLKDFEYELVNIKRIMGDNADVELVKESMISNAKEYGFALTEVAQVYTEIAQQGFNERQTESLARTALMAVNVEQSFQSAAEAQQMMTGAILNYGMAAENSEQLLDKLNEVSNQYPTTSKKLLDGINRVGAAAKNAGVDIDTLIGYLTVLNQSGFSGSVAGNAVKSFISFSSRDIAVDKLEKYVGVMKKANGDMMKFPELLGKIAEQWSTLNDVQRAEITQAIARGDQASRFIALMNNYGKALDVASTSETSFGSAQRENALAMTTLEKQSLQLKAAWDELIVTIGESGLLGFMKGLTQTATAIVDGFNSLPTPIRNTMTSIALLGAAILALNTGTKLLTGSSLVSLITGLANAAKAMLGMKTATDAANLSQKAFIATPIGAVLTAISLAIGAATLAWSYYSGAQSKVTEEMTQSNRDMLTLVNQYQSLKAVVDNNTKSDKEITVAKQELAAVIEKMSNLMPGLVSSWDEFGKAKDIDGEKLDEWKFKYTDSIRTVEQANLDAANTRKNELEKEIAYLKHEIINLNDSDLSIVNKWMGKTVEDLKVKWSEEMIALASKLQEEEQKIKNSQSALNSLNQATAQSVENTKNLTNSVSQSADAMDEYGESIDGATGANEEHYQSVEDMDKALGNLQSQIRGNSTSISELNSVLKQSTEEQGMNAASATDLILKYPELADAIYKTADGWAFEKDAVEMLRKAKIQKAIDELKAEKNSAFNVKMATDDRLKAYGIEASAIKSLSDLKAKLNGTKSAVVTDPNENRFFNINHQKQGIKVMTEKEAKEAAALKAKEDIFSDYEKEMALYDSQIDTLGNFLYVDPNFGVSSSKTKREKGKSSSKKDDPAQKSFDKSQAFIEHEKKMDRMNTAQELAAWERVQARYKQGSEQRKKADEQVVEVRKRLSDEISAKEKKSYDDSMKWISHQKGIREVAVEEELQMLLRVQARYKEGTEIRKELDEKVYSAQMAAQQEYFSNFTKGLNHKKALDEISTIDEIKEWAKIMAMYKEGTDQWMQAKEQIHSLNKKLLEDEKKTVTESATKIKTKLDNINKEAIKRIETERDTFIAAQDAKIEAIDAQIKAMDRLNSEDDYERKLAEKKDRLEILQSAVGKDGRDERKQVKKDIEDMVRDHERGLAKQSLEDKKQALQNEKKLKEQDYSNQIDAAKKHYDDLTNALDQFNSSVELKAEDLKQLQILKESEKNTEILKQLDQFIADYQAQLSRISSPTIPSLSVINSKPVLSEQDQDLTRYNNNIDKWHNGTKEDKATAHAENEELRKKYNIKKDEGKLQHFKDGGVVQGRRGEAVPVIAHAPEMFINERQQSNLFKLLNFKFPSLNFSMPTLATASGGGANPHQISNQFVLNSGDTYIADESTAKVYWSERDNFIRRAKSKGGGKF